MTKQELLYIKSGNTCNMKNLYHQYLKMIKWVYTKIKSIF